MKNKKEVLSKGELLLLNKRRKEKSIPMDAFFKKIENA